MKKSTGILTAVFASAMMMASAAVLPAETALPLADTAYAASEYNEAVSGIKYTATKNSLTVSWDALDSADTYKVYLKVKDSDDKLKLQNVKLTKKNGRITAKLTGLKAGTKYSVRIRPVADDVAGKSKTVTLSTKGTSSSSSGSFTYDEKVANVKYSASEDSITLSWDKLSSADGYKVYIKNDSGKYALKTSKVTVKNGRVSATITGLDKGTEYSFMIKPTCEKDGKTYSGKGKTVTVSTKSGKKSYKTNYSLPIPTEFSNDFVYYDKIEITGYEGTYLYMYVIDADSDDIIGYAEWLVELGYKFKSEEVSDGHQTYSVFKNNKGIATLMFGFSTDVNTVSISDSVYNVE